MAMSEEPVLVERVQPPKLRWLVVTQIFTIFSPMTGRSKKRERCPPVLQYWDEEKQEWTNVPTHHETEEL